MAEYCSLRSSCGVSVTAGAMRPEPWPITSCISVVSSRENPPHRVARSTSAASQQNSLRIASGVDRSCASLTLTSDTDLLP